MADQAAMQTMFQRLGCTIAAAQAIVNDQGIDSLAELKALKDSDDATLCKVIRCPGGARSSTPMRPHKDNLLRLQTLAIKSPFVQG
jgi:hypothetical protein